MQPPGVLVEQTVPPPSGGAADGDGQAALRTKAASQAVLRSEVLEMADRLRALLVVDTESKYRSAAPGFARELAERAGGRYYRLPGAEEGVFTDAVLRGRHARGDGERTGDGARRHRGRQAACARAAVMARLIKICCRMRPPTEHRARPLASRQVAPARAARGPCPRTRAVGAGGAARWAARASHSLPRPPPSAPKQRYGPYVATPFPRARAQARGRAGAAGG